VGRLRPTPAGLTCTFVELDVDVVGVVALSVTCTSKLYVPVVVEPVVANVYDEEVAPETVEYEPAPGAFSSHWYE
jgi:hypothetical protein